MEHAPSCDSREPNHVGVQQGGNSQPASSRLNLLPAEFNHQDAINGDLGILFAHSVDDQLQSVLNWLL